MMKQVLILATLSAVIVLTMSGCGKKETQPDNGSASATVTAEALSNAVKHYQTGRQLAMRGKFDAAVEQFNKAVELNPNYFQAYDKLGMLYYSKRQAENAVEPLKKALMMNPATTDKQANPGDIAIAAQNCAMLFDIGQAQIAFKHLSTLSQLHPDAPTVKTVQLFCKLAEEEKTPKEPLFQNFSASDIDACERNLMLAKGYVFLGNANSALAYYDKVAALCSDRPDALTQAAYYYAMARKPDKAIEICREGLKNDPDYYPLRYVLTSVYAALEMPDEAIETANEGVLTSPRDVRCYYLLANKYTKANQHAAAVGVYEAMLSYIEKDPGYFKTSAKPEVNDPLDEIESEGEKITDQFRFEKVYSDLALCHNYMENFEKATLYANKALKADNKCIPAYINLSAAYQGQQRYEKALQAIDKGIKLAPASILLYLEKAGIYHQMQKFEKAIEPLEKAILQEPQNAMACTGLAQTYSRLEQYADALPYFEKAVQNTPDMVNVVNVVACYVKLGQKQKALSAFRAYTGRDKSEFVLICCNDGNRALQEKRYEDATNSYETALYADAECPEAIFGLGCLYVETDRHDQAAKLATLLEKLNIDLYDKLTRYINSGKRPM